MREKLIIGRREEANLPDFGLFHVDVKIDSGAYTSSIHVSYCKETLIDGLPVLEVIFLDEKHSAFNGEKQLFDVYRLKKVKSSTGQEQLRYFISSKIELLGRKIKTEFSLTERRGMKYPILIGRKLLNNRFIIDTSIVNSSFTKKINE